MDLTSVVCFFRELGSWMRGQKVGQVEIPRDACDRLTVSLGSAAETVVKLAVMTADLLLPQGPPSRPTHLLGTSSEE